MTGLPCHCQAEGEAQDGRRGHLVLFPAMATWFCPCVRLVPFPTWPTRSTANLAPCPSSAPTVYPQRLLARPVWPGPEPLSWAPPLGKGLALCPTSWPSPATKWPPRPRKHLEPEEMAAQLVMSPAMWPVHQPCASPGLPGHVRWGGQACASPRGPWARPPARALAVERPVGMGRVGSGREDSWEDLAWRSGWRRPRPAGAGKHGPDREVSPASPARPRPPHPQGSPRVCCVHLAGPALIYATLHGGSFKR